MPELPDLQVFSGNLNKALKGKVVEKVSVPVAQNFLAIHNAKKKESPTGATIRHDTTGGRKTYYTDEQEVFQ